MKLKLIAGLLATTFFSSIAVADTLDVGVTSGGCCSSTTRGYYFVAPTDFTVTELFLAANAGPTSTLELLKFNSAVPVYSSVTNDFQSLGFWNGQSSGLLNIAVHSGDIIGVLGWNSTAHASPYRNISGSYLSSIGGYSVTLSRLGFQGIGHAANLWTENAKIGTIGLNYSLGITPAVPEPETYAMLLAGLGLMAGVARRKQK